MYQGLIHLHLLNVIHQKIDYLNNDLHYTDIQIMDKQKDIDYTVLCIYVPTVFSKYRVNLEDVVTLQEKKNSFDHD